MSAKQRTAYEDTKVSYLQTQGQVAALLDKHGVKDTRFSYLGTQNKLVLEFARPVDPNRPDKGIAGVRMVIPNVTAENRDQMHRVLFYYLKSKFESLAFGITDFLKEFFPYLVTIDQDGRMSTMYEVVGPGYVAALETGRIPQPNLLPWEGPKQLPGG